MKKQSILMEIQPLKQSLFKTKIIDDISFNAKKIDNKTGRIAEFKCLSCNDNYTSTVKAEQLKDNGLCSYCAYDQNRSTIMPLRTRNYKSILLYDFSFETKVQEENRKAIFQCTKCDFKYYEYELTERQKTSGSCDTCQEFKYKGIAWFKNTRKWKAQIQVVHEKITIGYYDSRIVAAIAYDKYVDDHNLNYKKNFN